MNNADKRAADPLTTASKTVAWVIALNKPIYPVYVWYLAEGALKASLLTLVSTPLFAGIIYLAGKNAHAARIGLVLIGICDTTFISLVLGRASGAWTFLLPCLTLAGVCFYKSEPWTSRLLVGLSFLASLLAVSLYPGLDLHLPEGEAESLFVLNAMGAVSLAAFISLRFPRMERS